MESLLEIHSHYEEQVQTAESVDRVYDFALPPLLLQALQSGSSRVLHSWLEMSPRNAITVLDTHDGIGIVDVGPSDDRPGLLTPEEIDELVEGLHRSTGGESRLATGQAASNLDLYQVNATYFSAVGEKENDYLLARLVQFLAPGIPQVYYAGLLAATNDMALLDETGVGRDINRPYFSRAEVEERLDAPVVRRLLKLIRFRNTHPAFDGEFELGPPQEHQLSLSWTGLGSSIVARVDFADKTFTVETTDAGTSSSISDWDSF
jgi:sucrose phosphorylase